jgi:hypothetical protein
MAAGKSATGGNGNQGLKVEDFVPDQEPEGGNALLVESAIYSAKAKYRDPNTGKMESYPVEGYLIDARPMLSQKFKDQPSGGNFLGFVFQLTKPCAVPKASGLDTADPGNLKIMGVGSEVILSAGEGSKLLQLEKYVGRARVPKLRVKPVNEIKVAGGAHTMIEWKIIDLGDEDRAKVTSGDGLLARLGDVVVHALGGETDAPRLGN